MSRPTSILESPLARQAPLSALLALSAVLSITVPSLQVTDGGLFVASLAVTGLATVVAAVALALPHSVGLVPALLVLDFVAIALFRTSTGAGASVFTSLAVLPVVWCGSLRGRLTVVYAALGVTLVIMAPYVLTPTNVPGASELVRLGVTVIVFGTVAAVVQELSRRARRNVRAARLGEERVRAEIDRAAAVQRSLLPTPTDHLGADVAVAGACLPAKSVGGDFFDWYETNSGIAVSLGDVMGKGVGAGLIAAAVRATVRSSRAVDDPSEALLRAADGLAAEGSATDVTFTTLFHARISTDGTFRWADAGHGLSLVLRSGGGVDRLRSSDLPLGMGLRDEWATTEGFLDTGDLLISFSDGVLDLFGGREDTVDAVADLARACGSEPTALVAALSARADEVAHDDDVTVIAIRRAPVATVASALPAQPARRERT
ncbi:serine phosphatase RsbU (regulator of sigma subunit) [Curtobacterium sp. PhB42]|uniref:PP2C family protein-serine/threonine phosphatase n=1 Tax=unclassified Curtobacterium TaxID=257496 RepID=UPI0010478DCC|nr:MULTISPECIES: SpoIIE family protein phosphatase [unclassified Curtobacterium]TCU83437.1 serine phosphatase RsbU (regulator of sigma subunit) [Curtobacterium sp. PhB191]TDW39158.1 serine phosphatase RsbU (regulator of sigma subunit) [Curtobacterium sp. PhB42]TDW50750.1 serine phosphatase RsbU (regulator of sigma subunit) [Curtobacterium sp. PhB190]